MTLLVWLGTLFINRKPPSPIVIWTANVLAALLFGALHLPQAAVFLSLTAPVVALTLAGNGVPGIVFGWLFWRRGLVAAMVAHFSADLVL
jgi:membrane protease YdiL (CAAX protease family)